MAYNDKPLIIDRDKKPIPQYFNDVTNQYEVVTGENGQTLVKDKGNILKLDEVKGEVIDVNSTLKDVVDETNKSILSELQLMNARLDKMTVGGEIKTTDVQTTPGRWWSEKKSDIRLPIESVENKLKTIPLDFKKRILLVGSSSSEGIGASTINKFYGKLLGAKLAQRGHEMIFRGISGDYTLGVINRFEKDIAAANPDFVIIALTIENEGKALGLTDVRTVYQHFRDNLYKLAYMVKKIGAVPILLTQAPTQTYTSEIYAYALKLEEELSASNIMCIDWGGAVDNLEGKPITGTMADTLHYNDVGHKEMANVFPPSLFDLINAGSGAPLATKSGCLHMAAPSTQTPIFFTPTDEITTFTASARFKKENGVKAEALISFNDTDRIWLSVEGFIAFSGSSANNVIVEDNVSLYDSEWLTLTLSYNDITKEVRIYVNGVQKAKFLNSIKLTKVTVGGREGSAATLTNAYVKDFVVYRTRLKDFQIRNLHDGIITQTSLELYTPLSDKVIVPGGNLINLAQTLSNAIISRGETGITAVHGLYWPPISTIVLPPNPDPEPETIVPDPPKTEVSKSMRYGTLTVADPVYYVPDTHLTRFSFFMRVRASARGVPAGIVSFNSESRIYLDTEVIGAINLSGTGDHLLVPAQSWMIDSWMSVGVVVMPEKSSFYVCGKKVLVLENPNTFPAVLSQLTIGGRPGSSLPLHNADLRDVHLYNGTLTDEEMLEITKGELPRLDSLIIHSPLTDATITPGGTLYNTRGTTHVLTVNQDAGSTITPKQ